MTEMRRKLGIKERSVGLQSPPSNPEPNARRHTMSFLAVPISTTVWLKTSLPKLTNGKFGTPSKSLKAVIKGKHMALPHNHQGFGVMSSSMYGNIASAWSCSPQSPPKIREIKSGMEVCTT